MFFADVVDCEDVGMIQPARGAGFFDQAMPASRVAGQFIAQNLQRDVAAQARVQARYTWPMPPASSGPTIS